MAEGLCARACSTCRDAPSACKRTMVNDAHSMVINVTYARGGSGCHWFSATCHRSTLTLHTFATWSLTRLSSLSANVGVALRTIAPPMRPMRAQIATITM